ncbi:MAG: histidine--tRNA ligase [Bacillota bacterium]|jgi:histidyl-tRNA synthetase|nr:histidine--tRNA ligase [Bacillota bacterium]HHU42750.1 histidine--tRNA ligase [Clostridiales bacterium]
MIRIQKGTKDVLHFESYKWHFIEDKIRTLAESFGIKEIRTPTFEATELFARSVGETTDIVNKEMYTFIDKGNRSVTLKPEGTAGVVRSYIENNLSAVPQPVKMYYLTPVFRYERPQSGRLREHHQFGIEYFGSDLPITDAEVILVAKTLFDNLGIKDLQLNINSIGCAECRREYNKVLIDFFSKNKESFCPLCQERMDKNPLRVLDCKEDKCIELNKKAPIVLDYLCSACKNHHEELKSILDCLDIAYEVNPYIVRGLDYYTKTVFEFISKDIGAQGTVCGGGRYNNLVEQMGGKSVPAIGFGMGLERLIMVMEELGLSLGEDTPCKVYIAPLGEEQRKHALNIAMALRRNNISAETDYMGRSLKAQMKYADKKGYEYVLVLGEDEIIKGKGVLKNMRHKGQDREIDLSQIEKYFLE